MHADPLRLARKCHENNPPTSASPSPLPRMPSTPREAPRPPPNKKQPKPKKNTRTQKKQGIPQATLPNPPMNAHSYPMDGPINAQFTGIPSKIHIHRSNDRSPINAHLSLHTRSAGRQRRPAAWQSHLESLRGSGAPDLPAHRGVLPPPWCPGRVPLRQRAAQSSRGVVARRLHSPPRGMGGRGGAHAARLLAMDWRPSARTAPKPTRGERHVQEGMQQ